ncbi:PREDICTED: RNA demethylase ALKBH5-like [Ipomoea nil]|uniref:RNA demethylase ALKBH5-like n=1 Tax=Ipomoea nil TaxID=35883 RepID=UPI00090175CE|nr:PREDICTED: RNA demethylase ALKBH5-like [Ipomoea nil]XP_019170337.1 PREDICTED: RNA demethylase ALKBH5-like [Ipomoea nil]
MDKLNIQFGEISFSSDNEAASEKATVVHAPRIAPTYLNRLQKMVSDASSPAPVNRNQAPASSRVNYKGLSEEEKREQTKFAQVKRKKDFVHYERVDGKKVNVVQGLELHTGIFDAEEQMKIVECVYQYQQLGQKGKLRARTYSEPKKWMRGKGRATIQFGCCYNYAVDKNGNPPGIVRDEEVDPLPAVFKQMIKRMVRWHVLPPTCVPNSCIVNIYEEGDCIPPHIDHHDFVRPFSTVSFLSECNILFGSSLKIVSPGEFSGPVSVPLPKGSVLVLQGNGADVAKHCVPGVPSKRISVTFRKMDESKSPFNYKPDPELLRIQPLVLHRSPVREPSTHQMVSENEKKMKHDKPDSPPAQTTKQNVLTGNEEFPPLGSFSSSSKNRSTRRVI